MLQFYASWLWGGNLCRVSLARNCQPLLNAIVLLCFDSYKFDYSEEFAFVFCFAKQREKCASFRRLASNSWSEKPLIPGLDQGEDEAIFRPDGFLARHKYADQQSPLGQRPPTESSVKGCYDLFRKTERESRLAE